MDYLPPGRVVRVGDRRFPRWVVKDAENRYWAGEGQWSDEPSEALLFCREIDAAKQKNRYCLGGDPADTFTATVVVTVHPALVDGGTCRFPGVPPGVFQGRASRQGRIVAGDRARHVEEDQAMINLLSLFTGSRKKSGAAAQPPAAPLFLFPSSPAAPRRASKSGSSCSPTTCDWWRGGWRTGCASTAAGEGLGRLGSCWRR